MNGKMWIRLLVTFCPSEGPLNLIFARLRRDADKFSHFFFRIRIFASNNFVELHDDNGLPSIDVVVELWTFRWFAFIECLQGRVEIDRTLRSVWLVAQP